MNTVLELIKQLQDVVTKYGAKSTVPRYQLIIYPEHTELTNNSAVWMVDPNQQKEWKSLKEKQ